MALGDTERRSTEDLVDALIREHLKTTGMVRDRAMCAGDNVTNTCMCRCRSSRPSPPTTRSGRGATLR